MQIISRTGYYHGQEYLSNIVRYAVRSTPKITEKSHMNAYLTLFVTSSKLHERFGEKDTIRVP